MNTRDLSPGHLDKRQRSYFLELRLWEAEGIDQSHMEPRTGLAGVGTLVPSSKLDFIITGLGAVCCRTQAAHFAPSGNLVFLGSELWLAMQTNASLVSCKLCHGVDQATPLLTKSGLPGAPLSRELAGDADGRELAQMGMPRGWKSPARHLKAFTGRMASQAFIGSGRDAGVILSNSLMTQMGKLRPREGMALPKGRCSKAPDSRAAEASGGPHCLSGEEPMCLRQEMDSPGPPQRNQLRGRPASGF